MSEEQANYRLRGESRKFGEPKNPGTGHAKTCTCDTCVEYWERQRVEPDRVDTIKKNNHPVPDLIASEGKTCDKCRHSYHRGGKYGCMLSKESGRDCITNPSRPFFEADDDMIYCETCRGSDRDGKPSLYSCTVCHMGSCYSPREFVPIYDPDAPVKCDMARELKQSVLDAKSMADNDELEKARAFTMQQNPKPPCDLCQHNKDSGIGPCIKCDAGNDQFLSGTWEPGFVLPAFSGPKLPLSGHHFTPIHDPDAPVKGMDEYARAAKIVEQEQADWEKKQGQKAEQAVEFVRAAWQKDRAPKNTALENKPKPSLIPFDICMEFDEPAYQEGLIKDYRESWRKGFPISEMYDATIRHLEKFFYHMRNYDPDAEKLGIKKHHLAGARFSIACMLQTLRDHPEMDDREKLFGKKGA